MCGIAGIVSFGRAIPESALGAMSAALAHRGPDDEGTFVEGGVALAMRRLSIIGVSNGRQPIFNEDGTVAVVMNGEIYNHDELRKGLESRGHCFKTSSDVEVAAHLYEEKGPDFVRELRGMFAYALYDRRRRRLLLGRDRIGKKPLYYAQHQGLFLFASELKALLATSLLPREIDGDGLRSYLSHGFVVGGRTLFQGVFKLSPAAELRVEAGAVRSRSYWDLPLPTDAPPESESFARTAQRVRELLEEAVRIRLMSEVPLGAFLSGGVDSSAVVGIMSRQLEAPVETFAVGFGDPEFDELVHARAAANLYGTNHHELVVRGCSADLLQEINWFHDEPAADPANVPTYCLSKFARQYVTVTLTGEGGDELFAGYRHYRLYRQLTSLERRTGSLQSVAAALSRLEQYAGRVGPRRLWKGLWVANLPIADRPRGLLSLFTDAEICRLVTPDLLADGHDYASAAFRALQHRADGDDFIAQSMYVDAKSQLPEQLLMKVDKMTMSSSLEARCPFLDQRLVEYVASLPTAMKISAAGSKLLLREALRGLVPDALLDRKKHGFEVPIRTWMLGELAPLAEEMLLRPGAPIHRYVDPVELGRRWSSLKTRKDHHLARQIWVLLNLAIWHEQHWPSQVARKSDARNCAAA